MSVLRFLELVDFNRLTGGKDDDSADRLNHVHTVVLLVLFAFTATGSMLVGSPMDCWTPAHFSYSYESYVQSYCWVKNTYYIPMDQPIPGEQVKRESEELTYYQWAPFILLFMALLFKLPCVVWRLFNQASGIDLGRVSAMTKSLLSMSNEDRESGVKRIAIQVDCWLKAHRLYQWNTLAHIRQRVSRLLCIFASKRESSYLTHLYIFVKLMYLVNVVCQFVLLNAFMGNWYISYGVENLWAIFKNGEWTESPRFPRVTLCDFHIRELANVQHWTVQCVLPINMFNEKLFFILWFWLVWVGLVTAGSTLLWLWRIFHKQSHMDYIKKYLVILDKYKKEDKKLVRKFAEDYLRDDGIFLLRLVAQNSNIILLSDTIGELWELYKKKAQEKVTDSSSGETSDPPNTETEEANRLQAD
ncbi:hypothetical protein ACOMHN_034564 [Nucella lapillus]